MVQVHLKEHLAKNKEMKLKKRKKSLGEAKGQGQKNRLD